jgi:hypothetical protein
MAEFSKQYVQNFETEIGGWDFDIEEIAEELEPNQAISMICEGFGFSWISKNNEGDTLLIFVNHSSGEINFKTLEETINNFKNEF